jgi:hypothetical protein
MSPATPKKPLGILDPKTTNQKVGSSSPPWARQILPIHFSI